MQASSVWAVMAVLLSAGAGIALAGVVSKALTRRRAADRALVPEDISHVQMWFSRGIKPLRPLARRMLRIRNVRLAAEHAVLLADVRGFASTPEAFVSLALGVCCAGGVLSALLTLSPVFGIAVCCTGLVGLYVGIRNAYEKRSLAMREEIPDALRAMETCFRCGLSLVQTLKQTAKECSGTLSRMFDTAARRLEMGAPPSEALDVLQSSEGMPELSFVAVALDVQHTSGGSIAPVLETARESVVSELNLMRSLRVQTAQASLSANIVTIMPFVLVALFSLVSPDFLKPFFSSVAGLGLLALALTMQFAGVLCVRHMLRIDAG